MASTKCMVPRRAVWEWVCACSLCVSRYLCVQLYGNILVLIYVCIHVCLCICKCVFVGCECTCVCAAKKWKMNLETWSQTWEAPIWAWFTEQAVHSAALSGGGMGQIARQQRARAHQACRRQGQHQLYGSLEGGHTLEGGIPHSIGRKGQLLKEWNRKYFSDGRFMEKRRS